MPAKPIKFSVEDAVRAAISYIQQIQGIAGTKVAGISVEGVELRREQGEWEITLSYDDPHADPFNFARTKKERLTKLVSVDVSSGDCLRMVNA